MQGNIKPGMLVKCYDCKKMFSSGECVRMGQRSHEGYWLCQPCHKNLLKQREEEAKQKEEEIRKREIAERITAKKYQKREKWGKIFAFFLISGICLLLGAFGHWLIACAVVFSFSFC